MKQKYVKVYGNCDLTLIKLQYPFVKDIDISKGYHDYRYVLEGELYGTDNRKSSEKEEIWLSQYCDNT